MYSFLWEVLLDLGLMDKTPAVEDLIAGAASIDRVEAAAKALELKKVKSFTKNETLDFESGQEFLDSPLVKHFLMPDWLEFLDVEDRERVAERLAEKIDEDRNDMTFRFSVKATVVSGETGEG